MRKAIAYLLICFHLATPAFGASETYFCSQTGAGANSGGNGTWATAPTSWATAMSIAQFNYYTNWNSSDSPTDIDPGDTVYLGGAITSTVWPKGDGASGSVITIRGDDATTPLTSITVDTDVYSGGWVPCIQLSDRSYITFYNSPGNRKEINGGYDAGPPGDTQCTDSDCDANPPATIGSTITEGVTNRQIVDLDRSSHIIFDNWAFTDGARAFYGVDGTDFTLINSYIYETGEDGARFADFDNIRIGGTEATGNEFYRTGFRVRPSPYNTAEGGAFQIQGGTGGVFSYNYIHGTPDKYYDGWLQGGILAYGTDKWVIEYNTIKHFGAHGQRSPIHYKSQQYAYGNDNIIRFNNMEYGIQDDDWGYATHAAINLNRNINGLVCAYNRAHHFQSGISVMNASAYCPECHDGVPTRNIYIFGNSVSDLINYGIRVHHGDEYDNPCDVTDPCQNTVYDVCTDDVYNIFAFNNSLIYTEQFVDDGSGFDTYSVFSLVNSNHSYNGGSYTNPVVKILNNIFSHGRYGETPNFLAAVNYDSLNGGTNYLDLDDNLWFDPNDTTSFNFKFNLETFCSGSSPCEYTDGNIPAAWMANATVGNPQFLDYANGNLRLSASSAAINAGTDPGITIPDITGLTFYASVTGNSSTQSFSDDIVLDPSTNWNVHPPVVVLVDNSASREIGAYAYETTAAGGGMKIYNQSNYEIYGAVNPSIYGQ